ncbi:DNA-dependent ATPase mgs1 [Xanthoria calcicola]
MVNCPICGKSVKESKINLHLDSFCELHVDTQPSSPAVRPNESPEVSSFFKKTPSKGISSSALGNERPRTSDAVQTKPGTETPPNIPKAASSKRHAIEETSLTDDANQDGSASLDLPAKRLKTSTAAQRAAPLAERMRPRTLDDVYGQELVGPDGVLRGLIETDRVPSMILWGGAGTGKTTIARVIATIVGSRFIEINSTSSGVGECKKIFAEAGNELRLTGRKTIIFCDEIHRFSKSQQDVFLGPVESGQVTLIGATTENPSFKVQNALLSRCRTFTLQKLADADVNTILQRALDAEGPNYSPSALVDTELIHYLSAFADGDARTGLNLLELAMDVSKRPHATKESIKSALTKTLVYDRAGDQHYDTISALHKSVRGSEPHASLYYLERMLTSGEDPLYIARRLVIIASEDVGLADNTLLPLATATYSACEKIGMPECRINLAHCVSALALAKKSTRAYRGLSNAGKVLKEPGMAGLPIPMHLRNAPTRLLKEIGAGREYKYNPSYRDGRVKQEYLPERLRGSVFLEDEDLGVEVDEDLDLSGESQC